MSKLIAKSEYAELCGISRAAVTKALKTHLKPALVGPRIDFEHPAAQAYYREKTAPRLQEPAAGIDPLFEDALTHCQTAGRWSANTIQRNFSIGYARAQVIFAQLQTAGHVPEKDQTKYVPPPGQSKPPAPAAKPRQHGKGRKSSWEDEEQLLEVPDDIEELADLPLRELIARYGTGYRFHDWLKALKEIEAINEKRIKNAQSQGQLISRKLVEVGVIDPFNSAHVRLMTDGAKAITAAVVSKAAAGISEQEIEAYVADLVGSFIRPVKNKVERNLASVTVD